MFFGRKQNKELEDFANILSESIVKMFRDKGGIKLSQPPEIERKNLIEYDGRMRAEGMEKFNDPTYVSALNYYVDKKSMEAHKAIGTIIVYVQQDYVATIMKLLQYPKVDDENEEALKDSCGALCNIIGGAFKSGISAKGYVELEMSAFSSYRNNIPHGVEFCYNEYEKFELRFFIEKEKRMVVEMSMGVIPKR